MDPTAACVTSRFQNFPFPTSQCPKMKRLSFVIACSQTSSPPPAMSSTATPTVPWYPCCGLLSTNTYGSNTDESKPSLLAVGRKQILHSRVPSASPFTVLSNCTQHHEIHLERHRVAIGQRGVVLSVDRVTGVGSLLHISQLQLGTMAAHGPQDGECDSMSRRSGSVTPFVMSRALARRADGVLSSGFQIRAQRVASALELQPFLPEMTLWRLGSLAGSATQYPCSSGTFRRCQLAHVYLFALPYLSCARRDCKECPFRDPTLRPITTHFRWLLRQGNICSDLIIFRFHIR